MTRHWLSPDAQFDLDEIRQYTTSMWGPQQAVRYLAELTLKFEQLAAAPGIGRLRPEIEDGVRSFKALQHIVFYRQEPDGVEVVRVLHPSRDIEAQFSDE